MPPRVPNNTPKKTIRNPNLTDSGPATTVEKVAGLDPSTPDKKRRRLDLKNGEVVTGSPGPKSSASPPVNATPSTSKFITPTEKIIPVQEATPGAPKSVARRRETSRDVGGALMELDQESDSDDKSLNTETVGRVEYGAQRTFEEADKDEEEFYWKRMRKDDSQKVARKEEGE
ncbi:hypothetical protein HYFRA_00000658 [Hymenoscyphus fraxineus]|uniref:Uncharacterized protein n=1 Tax=Hymenoscyphus fraxineus TaxID=746836 RepID=A0A9N9L563_9HELO|nr:hypothetical protein HYFRA_00000658 [Hymenoscyphus fraxineus]